MKTIITIVMITLVIMLSGCEVFLEGIGSYSNELTADSLVGNWGVSDNTAEYIQNYPSHYDVYLSVDSSNIEGGLLIKNFANENITIVAELDDSIITIPIQTFELDITGNYHYEIQGNGIIDSSRTGFEIEYYLVEHYAVELNGSQTGYTCIIKGERSRE